MKIGILSMQRVLNYGSFMQSYCLKREIERLGHQCVFIDIKAGEKIVPLPAQKNKKFKSLLKKLDFYAFKRLKHYFSRKKKTESLSKGVVG